MKLKKGDTIIVRAGKDKGKTGVIEKVFLKENTVLVTGINMFKKHMKRRDEKNPGGIIDITKPIDVSKVAFYDPKAKKPARLGYLVTKGEKTRINKRNGQAV
jgi:large subunit ribosomal protein L24